MTCIDGVFEARSTHRLPEILMPRTWLVQRPSARVNQLWVFPCSVRLSVFLLFFRTIIRFPTQARRQVVWALQPFQFQAGQSLQARQLRDPVHPVRRDPVRQDPVHLAQPVHRDLVHPGDPVHRHPVSVRRNPAYPHT